MQGCGTATNVGGARRAPVSFVSSCEKCKRAREKPSRAPALSCRELSVLALRIAHVDHRVDPGLIGRQVHETIPNENVLDGRQGHFLAVAAVALRRRAD